MSIVIKDLNVKQKTQQMFLTQPLKFCSNWLFHHPSLLGRFGIIPATRAKKEIKTAIFHNIDNNNYMKAMNGLCRLNDLRRHPNAFYDMNDYHLISLSKIKNAILKA